jgi:DNA-binding NarL/FixJ family response regulator
MIWVVEQTNRGILIVEHNPLLLEGLCTHVGLQPDMEVVAIAASASEAVRMFRQHRPKIVLMDLDLPEETGIRAIREIREIDPAVSVIGLLTYEWDTAWRLALDAGARNCVTKDKLTPHLVGLIYECF